MIDAHRASQQDALKPIRYAVKNGRLDDISKWQGLFLTGYKGHLHVQASNPAALLIVGNDRKPILTFLTPA